MNAFLINLPERKDRLNKFLSELNHFPLNIEVVNGIHHQEPKIGIALAHINCIRIAQQRGYNQALIIEDDCYFPAKEAAFVHFHKCLNNLPNEWDVLLGGVYDSRGLTYHNEYWNQTDQHCGGHFYIINESMFERALSYDNTHHFDRYLNLNSDRKCFVAKKMFAIQRNGYSDNMKAEMNYDHKLKPFELLK